MSSAIGLVVVTGAAGMIGSNLVARLLDAGRPVVACDWPGAAERHDWARGVCWVSPDHLLADLETRAAEISAIVHLGAISSTTETDVRRLELANVIPTVALWQFAARHGCKYVYASSAATYGNGDRGFADTDTLEYLDSLTPLNPYGWSKHSADQQIVAAWRSLAAAPPSWAGLKFFNVYGAGEEHKGDMRSLVRKIVPEILAGHPVRLFRSHRPDYADGEQLRDFIHVHDACSAVLKALDRDDLAGLYNVGTGVARSFLDLALATFAALGRRADIEYVDMPAAVRGQYQYYTCAEVAKARAAGIHSADFSLEEGVASYVTSLLHGGEARA